MKLTRHPLPSSVTDTVGQTTQGATGAVSDTAGQATGAG